MYVLANGPILQILVVTPAGTGCYVWLNWARRSSTPDGGLSLLEERLGRESANACYMHISGSLLNTSCG
jgi:hypothetical protein